MDLLSWLFPRRCVGCKELGSYICPDCINKIVPMREWYCPVCRRPSRLGETHLKCKNPLSLDGLVSCYPYRGLMMKIITKFKYSFVKDVTNTLVELMVSAADYPLFFKHHWVMVPIPLHISRKRWRGFNQAEVLTDGLVQAWGWTMLADLLVRTRNTQPQMMLSGRKRKDNLRGAFEVNKRVVVPGRIIIIDDVATTCSTLNECARVLKKAGAKEVWALTLAQTIPK